MKGWNQFVCVVLTFVTSNSLSKERPSSELSELTIRGYLSDRAAIVLNIEWLRSIVGSISF